MKQIINCIDGTIDIVELTDADMEQQKIDAAEVIAAEKAAKKIADEAASAKAALLEKLGISEEEAKLLLA